MNVIILALWIELAGAQTSRLLRVNHMNNHWRLRRSSFKCIGFRLLVAKSVCVCVCVFHRPAPSIPAVGSDACLREPCPQVPSLRLWQGRLADIITRHWAEETTQLHMHAFYDGLKQQSAANNRYCRIPDDLNRKVWLKPEHDLFG